MSFALVEFFRKCDCLTDNRVGVRREFMPSVRKGTGIVTVSEIPEGNHAGKEGLKTSYQSSY